VGAYWKYGHRLSQTEMPAFDTARVPEYAGLPILPGSRGQSGQPVKKLRSPAPRGKSRMSDTRGTQDVPGLVMLEIGYRAKEGRNAI